MALRIPETHALEPDIYPAELAALETKESEFGEYRLWTFRLDNGATTTAVSSDKLGPRSKAYGWIEALIGRKPAAGEEVDPVGRRCRIDVRVDDESGYNRIAAVLPASEPPMSSAEPDEGTLNLERLDDKVFSQTAEIPF